MARSRHRFDDHGIIPARDIGIVSGDMVVNVRVMLSIAGGTFRLGGRTVIATLRVVPGDCLIPIRLMFLYPSVMMGLFRRPTSPVCGAGVRRLNDEFVGKYWCRD